MSRTSTVYLECIGEVLVEHSSRARRVSIRVGLSGVRVAVPAGMPLSRGAAFALKKQDWIRHHLLRVESLARAQEEAARHLPHRMNRTEARRKIITRIHELSEMYGLPYTRVAIRSQKTRWGSCSLRNAISLNINLARLPDALMDYVIVHELLHTRIRGHGSEFWKTLDFLVGDSQKFRNELRKYSPEML